MEERSLQFEVFEKRMVEKKVSLVLSSGGARGLAHIAVIDELEKRGYEIASIAGTSMGAFVGGIYASGNLNIFKEWMYSLKTIEIVKLFDITLSNNGLLKGERLFHELGKLFPDSLIENLPIPFAAVSTDILNNREVIHQSGSLFHAIRASISIPTFFQPFKTGNTYLVDGGLLNPTPVNRVKRFENDRLVVVNVETQHVDDEIEKMFYSKKAEGKSTTVSPLKFIGMPGYFDLINKTIGLMLSQLADLTIEKYTPDLLINMNRNFFGTYDFHKYSEIIEFGNQIAVKKIDEYEGVAQNGDYC
ncbi:MAG TPA: patatin-like phospholipase family protein [Prolixibacteraceae bacterium]|nr:patatin-like phospholipase family protein [Prolixibacteraceae bacterium]